MKKLITIIIGLSLVGTGLTTAWAATEPVLGDDCNIAAYPYNPSATPLYSEGGSNNEINFLTRDNKVSQSDCRNRIPYDQEHLQNNLDAQYENVSLDNSVQVPRATHIHSYVNDMKQDSNYYYRSFVYSFDIELEKDTLENTKLENIGNTVPEGFNLTCTTPSNTATPELHKCDGYNASAYGGTKVTIYEQPDRWVIRWSFGVNPAGEYEGARLANVPARWGNNSDLNTALKNYLTSKGLNPGTVNLADQNSLYRIFDPEVTITSKDKTTTAEGNKSIWTATTTSRVKVINYAIAKNRLQALNNGTIDDTTFFEKYCVSSDNGKDYIYENNAWQECKNYQYWTPINSVSSSGLSLPSNYANDTRINYKNSNGETLHFNKAFWIAVGSVASVWKSTPSQPQTLACADLKWDGAFKKPSMMGIYLADTVNPNALLPNEKAIMKFQTIYENGLGTKRPLEYRWVAFYGEQSRPAWFKNNDTLSGFIQQAAPALKPMAEALLQSSLPGRLLKVAHAAPSLGSSASLSSSILPSATETPTAGSLVSTGGSASLAPIATSELMAAPSAQVTAITMIGNFKDEISAAISENPLTDDDNQVFYSGGSEGVTVGVQAFYADGKNIPDDGPLVSTPDGLRQKADPCHLELVIQPKPVTCIDLEISPKTLEANTPATFTVTPKFSPSNKSLPLNYRWSAERYTSLIGNLNLGNGILGAVLEANPHDIQFIPGATEKDTLTPTWVGNGIHDVIQTGSGLADLTDPCFWGNCDQEEPSLVPLTPGDPIDSASIGALAGQAASDLTTSEINQFFGTNIFTDFGSPADYGQTAIFNAGSLYSSQSAINTAGLKQAADISVLPIALSHGGFKDAQTSPGLGANPYLETTDNKTFYTGGPENTLIKVQAEGKDGTPYPACSEKLVIPPVPGSICELLKVNFYDGSILTRKDDMVAGKTYRMQVDKANSVRDDGTPITEYTLVAYNPAGVGKLTAASTNAASCTPITTIPVINPGAEIAARGTQVPTSVDCQYLYTPNAGDKITLLADPHDNVAACRLDQIIPGATNICELLKVNFYENGTLVRKEQMAADKTYTIEIDQANSVRDDGTPIEKFVVAAYNPDGVGQLTEDPDNADSCSAITDIPLGDPDANGPIIARGTKASTDVSCKYVYRPNAGDKITLLADPHDNVAACRVDQTVPSVPTGPICKSLNLQTSPSLSGNEIAQGQIVTFAPNPIDTEDKPRPPVVYSETGNGYFVAPNNAPVPDCPAVPASGTFEAASSCRYSYQAPNDGTEATVTIKVKQDDGVAECLEEFVVKPSVEEKCLALNLRVNGQYTLNPQIVAGQSYHLMVEPITTLGKPISMVEWTVNGGGELIGSPSNPGICPAAIQTGAVSTLSICQYIFASHKNDLNPGFSVRAVPDDGVAACKAEAIDYTPPEIPPYCLYLDLDYTPEPFQTAFQTNMNATVVMSDGSPYNDRVRFTSTNGAGNFSGGISPIINSSGNDLRSLTNSNNNTNTVKYQNGTTQSGINVFLSDTNVRMSASCMRQLRPVPEFTPPCTIPPTIERKDGNKYCAEDGDSESYCWTIEGENNDLMFTTGSNRAIGDCVELDESYEKFELLVEDCNPLYRDYCYDFLSNDETPEKPTIEKRISKTTSNYGRSVSFSTNGNTTFGSQVNYQIKFEPKNYPTGTDKLMNATIADPAFDGIINGYKYPDTDKANGVKGDQITVDKTNIKVAQGDQFLSATPINNCPNNFDPEKDLDNGPCYRYETKGVYKTSDDSNTTGTVMVIYGIDSNDPIWITYFGLLKQTTASDQLDRSGLTQDDCEDGSYCLERFYNQSYVSDMEYCEEETFTDENGDSYTTWTCEPDDQKNNRCEFYIGENGERILINGDEKDCEDDVLTIATEPTWVEIVCSYFLTRASGDVFLEDELTYGIDVSKCYPFKNVSSVIVKPIEGGDGTLAGTGLPTVVSISHEICSAGQNEDPFTNLKLLSQEGITALKELFGSEISELSSQICEVGLVPGSDWNKENIATAMAQNIGKLTRWSSGIIPANPIYDFNTLEQASPGRVYYYNGENSSTKTVTIEGLKIEDGKGAYTIIVENADLQINGNIEYTAEGLAPQSADEIASLGIIVLNGNMYVAPDVEKLAGAYFVQRTGTADSEGYYENGNILSGSKGNTDEDSQTQLTINGSIYGNIGHLWSKRVYAGDITKDEGSITIRYDQRIIQNPPAGLTDLLGTFSQTQIVQ